MNDPGSNERACVGAWIENTTERKPEIHSGPQTCPHIPTDLRHNEQLMFIMLGIDDNRDKAPGGWPSDQYRQRDPMQGLWCGLCIHLPRHQQGRDGRRA